MSATIAIVFFVLLIAGMPIAFVLGVTSFVVIVQMGIPGLYKLIPSRFYEGMNMFPLMAMPLFILAGDIMNRTGITEQVAGFAYRLVGHLRGGLAHANIVASILFAGLTGSAVADSAALGTMLIPAMEKEGYPRAFAAAVTAASSCIGPIIPPSIIMVLYGSFMGVSIAGMFAGGIVPGLLMGVSLMLISYRIAKKHGYPKAERRATVKEMLLGFKEAFLALLMPAIILGGILGGLFTPTEAAAVAVAYALFIGFFVYRNIKVRNLWGFLTSMTNTTAIVFIILSTASIFSWLLTSEQVPQKVASLVLSITTNRYIVLLIINIILLIVGCFMDLAAALIVLAPVLAPLALKVGVHPLHFGLIMCLNLTIGLTTPPLGACLFTCCSVGNVTLEQITRPVLPLILALIAVLLLITYVPAVCLTIPRLLGFA